MYHTVLVCRASLQECFEACKKADKAVKLPELPKRMIELLPPEGVLGPKEPPGTVCHRLCLLCLC